MADTKKPLTNEEILVKVEAKVKEGVGLSDSKLSRERDRITDYYNGILPARQSQGRSSYVSTDVYDAVESMKSQLVETFSGNTDNLISFPTLGEGDSEQADKATIYVNNAVFRANPGHNIFQSVIHDGLTARAGIVKVFWQEDYEHRDEEFEGASYEHVQGLVARDDVTDLSADAVDPLGQSFNGTMTKRIDRSKVCITPVPPEEFVIEERCVSLHQAGIVGQQTLKTRAELYDMGYPKSKVDKVAWEGAKTLDLTPENLSRHDATIGAGLSNDDPIQNELQKVLFKEIFVRMNIDGTGVKLWKVCYAGSVLLSKDEVDCAPFKVFTPLPISHSFWGNNFAAKVVPYQNARTVLTRAILDHASITTNPRWGVLKGGLANPKELMDNRLGGIVNFNRPDAVSPLEQQPLNPFVFQTLEMLKSNKEETTSISSLSQGLNKDAVSNQNSQGLVQDLVALSQGRQTTIARNFAYDFLIPLFLEVYRLAMENDKDDRLVEYSGKYANIAPRDWIERPECRVSMHLGYGEKERQAQKLQATYMGLASDPDLKPIFKLQNRFDLAMDTMKAGGLENHSRYLSPPEQADQQQPDPFKVKELEIKDKQAEATLSQAQTKAQQAQADAHLEAIKVSMEQMNQKIEAMFKTREADRMDADIANKIDVAQREMTLAEKAPAEAQNVIVSANS